MSHKDIGNFQKSLKRKRRDDRTASTSTYQKVGGQIEMDTRTQRKLKQELTSRGGKVHAESGGLSQGAKYRLKRSARKSLAKMEDTKNLSPAERRKLVAKYMKDVDALWGEGGRFTDARVADASVGKGSARSRKSKIGPKTGLFSALAGAGVHDTQSNIEKSQNKTIAAGTKAARSMQTGTDRDGNRISYGADRGMGSSSSRRGGGMSGGSGLRSSSSRPRF